MSSDACERVGACVCACVCVCVYVGAKWGIGKGASNGHLASGYLSPCSVSKMGNHPSSVEEEEAPPPSARGLRQM